MPTQTDLLEISKQIRELPDNNRLGRKVLPTYEEIAGRLVARSTELGAFKSTQHAVLSARLHSYIEKGSFANVFFVLVNWCNGGEYLRGYGWELFRCGCEIVATALEQEDPAGSDPTVSPGDNPGQPKAKNPAAGVAGYALEPTQVVILRHLKDTTTRTHSVVDLVEHKYDLGNNARTKYGEKTVRSVLKRLVQLGLAHRPNGARQGVTTTPQGDTHPAVS
ncbi:MAG: hypothetical protein GY842_13815 [bacterium]|nr:hypothetical protein [bacterium]